MCYLCVVITEDMKTKVAFYLIPSQKYVLIPDKALFLLIQAFVFRKMMCQVLCIKSDKMEYKVIRLLRMSHASIARSYFWH